MSEIVLTKDVDFAALEAEIDRLLKLVDAGDFDDVLAGAGVERPAGQTFAGEVELSAGQGLSPNGWGEIIATFSPVVAVAATDIWKVVVLPKLKRAFRADRVKGKGEDRT